MASARYVFAIFYFVEWMSHCNAVFQGSYPIVLAEQLNQYCDWRMSKGNITVNGNAQSLRVGKAGPRGLRGVQGPAGKVNYTFVEQLVEQRLAHAGYFEKLSNLTKRVERLEEELQNQSVTQDTNSVATIASQSITRDCHSASKSEAKVWNGTGGVFDIYPDDSGKPMEVYCDLTTDGGGWVVFQRRMDGSENFRRDFADYVAGFGKKDKEFWLGLEKLHKLTKNKALELRVDLTDWDSNKAFAFYSNFSVGDASSQYKLSVGDYSGTAGDSLGYHNSQKFYASGSDAVNSCTTTYKGGWWYKGCHYSNLNGIYRKGGKYTGQPDGLDWFHWKGYRYSMKFVEMKMR